MTFASSLNVKAVVAAFNQEKALVGAFSVLTNLRMELFQALARKYKAVSCIIMLPAGHHQYAWDRDGFWCLIIHLGLLRGLETSLAR